MNELVLQTKLLYRKEHFLIWYIYHHFQISFNANQTECKLINNQIWLFINPLDISDSGSNEILKQILIFLTTNQDESLNDLKSELRFLIDETPLGYKKYFKDLKLTMDDFLNSYPSNTNISNPSYQIFKLFNPEISDKYRYSEKFGDILKEVETWFQQKDPEIIISKWPHIYMWAAVIQLWNKPENDWVSIQTFSKIIAAINKMGRLDICISGLVLIIHLGEKLRMNQEVYSRTRLEIGKHCPDFDNRLSKVMKDLE